jgi:hypothetical protein
MKKLCFVPLLALCGFTCAVPSGGEHAEVPDATVFGARNAAWESDPCADVSLDECGPVPLQCACSRSDEWSLVDRQSNSPYNGQDLSPTSFGKVSLWAYYWAECGTCIQQIAYLQTIKDTLKAEGYDIEIVGIAYNGSSIGTLGSSPREPSGACNGARASLPSCAQVPGQIVLDIPVVANGGSVAQMHDVSRGDWFVYRADGRLHEFIRSEELEPRNGFLGDGANWDRLIRKLKAAVMVPSVDEQPCSNDYGCTVEGQWCQFEQGSCGGKGRCVTSELPVDSNRSMGVVQQVCYADGVRLPVCSCDGRSYASLCDAELDEANIGHLGACE